MSSGEERPILYAMRGSPFTWRVWLALVEKGVDVEIKVVNAYSDDPEWLRVSPKGLAPVLGYKGNYIPESSVLCEYVEDEWSACSSLFPEKASDKAYIRIWIDFVNKKIVAPFFNMVFEQDKAKQEEEAKKLLEALVEFSGAMRNGGPYFMGEQFTMADVSMGPFAAMFYILKYFRNFEVPDSPEYARYTEWEKAVLARESWKDIFVDEKTNIEKWRAAAEGRHVPKMAKDTMKKP